jgi:hypothetical protein
MKEKKTFNVRLDKKEWFFLKMYAAEQEKTMNDVLAEYVRKLLRKDEKGVDMLKC